MAARAVSSCALMPCICSLSSISFLNLSTFTKMSVLKSMMHLFLTILWAYTSLTCAGSRGSMSLSTSMSMKSSKVGEMVSLVASSLSFLYCTTKPLGLRLFITMVL